MRAKDAPAVKNCIDRVARVPAYTSRDPFDLVAVRGSHGRTEGGRCALVCLEPLHPTSCSRGSVRSVNLEKAAPRFFKIADDPMGRV